MEVSPPASGPAAMEGSPLASAVCYAAAATTSINNLNQSKTTPAGVRSTRAQLLRRGVDAHTQER